MKSIIRIKNIELYGWHGISDKEKTNGQKFELDIEVSLFLNSNIESDEIEETVDYCALFNRVRELFFEKKYNLIECLANKISKTLLKEFPVSDCNVIIRKPDAPIDCSFDSVEVEVQCCA